MFLINLIAPSNTVHVGWMLEDVDFVRCVLRPAANQHLLERRLLRPALKKCVSQIEVADIHIG